MAECLDPQNRGAQGMSLHELDKPAGVSWAAECQMEQFSNHESLSNEIAGYLAQNFARILTK